MTSRNKQAEVPIRLVINALSARTGGGLTYAHSIVAALAGELQPGENVLVLAAPWNYDRLAELATPQISVELVSGISSLPVRLLYEQAVIPFRFRNSIIFSPGNIISFLARSRSILVVQNLMLFEGDFPTTRGSLARIRFELERALCRLSSRSAYRVVAVSRTMQDSILSIYPGAKSRCILVYSGLPLLLEPGIRPAGFEDHSPFGLVMTADLPHKRLSDAIEGWARSKSACNASQLVIVGDIAPARQLEFLAEVPAHLHHFCRFVGTIGSRAEISWLLANARYLISPSALESFGLPAIEAGSLGCPALLSDIPAHREVADGHAQFFSVGDTLRIGQLIDLVCDGNRISSVWRWNHTWESYVRDLMEEVRLMGSDAGRSSH